MQPVSVVVGDRVLLPGWGGNAIKVGEDVSFACPPIPFTVPAGCNTVACTVTAPFGILLGVECLTDNVGIPPVQGRRNLGQDQRVGDVVEGDRGSRTVRSRRCEGGDVCTRKIDDLSPNQGEALLEHDNVLGEDDINTQCIGDKLTTPILLIQLHLIELTTRYDDVFGI